MPYSGVYVFGDSLVDSGNALELAEFYGDLTFSDLPEGAPSAERGYFNGRFTNGWNFADLVSNKYIGIATKPVFPYGYEDPWLGVPIAPWASDPSGNNLNFAYGGAQIRQGEEVVPDLDGQTDAFRDAVDGDADPGALHLITIGGNDVRNLAPSGSDPASYEDALAALQEAAAKLYTEISQLIEMGATNVVVTGTPDVGLIPRYDRDGDRVLSAEEQTRADAATQYSVLLDGLIQEQLGQLQSAYPAADIAYVSLMDATDENLAYLEALYGRTIDPLADQELLFFDQIHPNAQSHALLAAAILDTLNGVTGNNRLPLTAFDYQLAGSIGVTGEIDRVTISLAAGATYTFEMLGLSSNRGSLADPSVRILGPNGGIAASNDDGGLGLDASLTFTVGVAGDYVFELSGVGSMTGAYSFFAAGDALGDDVYAVTHSNAVILEHAGEGFDTVRTSVNYLLGTNVSIERLEAAGTANINLTGNTVYQTLVGNAGNNVLDGKGGNDEMWGGAGKDTFTFTSRPSTTNIDRIRDFNPRDDTIALDDATFAGLPVGTIAKGAFATGTAAKQTDDRIIYDPISGNLWFDPDGIGGAAQIQFAVLDAGLKLTANDFIVI